MTDCYSTTVPAAADGTAAAVITPTTTGIQDLVVTSTLADSAASDSTAYEFDVAGMRPQPRVSGPAATVGWCEFRLGT
jgi:hypothetical protein